MPSQPQQPQPREQLLRGAGGRRDTRAGRAEASFAAEVAGAESRTRVGVDLQRSLARPKSDDNLLSFDGDEISVPTRRTMVEIRGAVNASTAVSVNAGASFRYYVRAAGGATAAGDEKRGYVIQPNGKIEARERILWVFVRDPTPRAGATVVVPTKVESNAGNERLATVSIIAQTIASLAAVIAIVR